MPEGCCVPKCKSKHSTNHLFKFPNNEIFKNKWEKNIPRKNWRSSNWSRICDVHFEPHFIIKKQDDLNEQGRKYISNLLYLVKNPNFP